MQATLDTIVKKHRESGGNIISLLQDTQEAFGYVPKEAVLFFADELGIAPSRFYGVATFYAQFRLKPSGKHRVTACCGTACHVRGAERILNSIKRELHLGEEEDTTPDNQFTVEKVACLGFCSFAPVVLINGAVHGKTTADPVLKEIKVLMNK